MTQINFPATPAQPTPLVQAIIDAHVAAQAMPELHSLDTSKIGAVKLRQFHKEFPDMVEIPVNMNMASVVVSGAGRRRPGDPITHGFTLRALRAEHGQPQLPLTTLPELTKVLGALPSPAARPGVKVTLEIPGKPLEVKCTLDDMTNVIEVGIVVR